MTRPSAPHRIAVDAHVHLHDEGDALSTLEAAARNFAQAAPQAQTGVCMLVEREGFAVFRHLRGRLVQTGEAHSLWLDDGRRLLVVAGRQIVSAEGLEVLGLGFSSAMALERKPAGEIVAAIHAARALPVLPWGVGKWLGARGGLVDRLLQDDPALLLGDNGGRPGFWRVARFSGKRRVLAGSDPLPLPGSSGTIGRFGFLLDGTLPAERPAEALLEALRDPATELTPYGSLASPMRFLRDQTRLRLAPRKAAR
ncbi:hypothetical protein [Novosphingobium sp. KN65.2]|uniref:hypothetical protein n=1 Tax=Novosphingobium sp. KN65.2 TaxID=1478134 RepID=UPI0005E551D8|nr:hypothetical protein [Novosphingobium sp. KN65.2]CDO35689.1 conserved hypothetical protein [Novosphingobium sp. KN65.2]